jgi:hypothetical protein
MDDDAPILTFHPWTDSPMIREALKERPPEEISILHCDRCGSVAYYNDGSHATCVHCDADLDHLIDDAITLADHFEAMADEDEFP